MGERLEGVVPAGRSLTDDVDQISSDLHEERLEVVARALARIGATSVLDLGCGTGILLARLSEDPRFTRLAGLDTSVEALAAAERRLEGALGARRVFLYHGSFDAAHSRLGDFDAALMVETIEHIDPRRLSAVEHVLFARYRPATVLITTPNREYNALYGMPDNALRHPEHRFEWTRGKFRSWASGVAARTGYGVSLCGIGEPDLVRGSPTQMATFRRNA